MPFTEYEIEILQSEDMGDAQYLSGEYDPGFKYDELPTSVTYFSWQGDIYQWGEYDCWNKISYDKAIDLDLVHGPHSRESGPILFDVTTPIGKSKEKRGATMRYWIVYPDITGRPSTYEPIAKAKWINLSLPEVSM